MGFPTLRLLSHEKKSRRVPSGSLSHDGLFAGGCAAAGRALVLTSTEPAHVRPMVHQTPARTVDAQQWKGGDPVTLAQLRAALPTRRKS